MSGLRVAVLVSGSGTNLQALLDAARADQLGGAHLALVLSNRADAGALVRAAQAGVGSRVVDHRAFADRAAFDEALVAALQEAQIELVVLAGFMRVLGAAFLRAFPGRIINIHPSLLPSFPGVDGQGQAFAQGVRIAGCTVHFVDEGTDTGPIIAQAAIPVHGTDDPDTLAKRILTEEHRLLPEVVRWIAEGRVTTEGRTVRVRGADDQARSIRSPEIER